METKNEVKFFMEGKVIGVEDYIRTEQEIQEGRNADVKCSVVFETTARVRGTKEIMAPAYIKAKSLVKPSKLNEVLKFEARLTAGTQNNRAEIYYRLLREVK